MLSVEELDQLIDFLPEQEKVSLITKKLKEMPRKIKYQIVQKELKESGLMELPSVNTYLDDLALQIQTQNFDLPSILDLLVKYQRLQKNQGN